jgi:hypothetical protein
MSCDPLRVDEASWFLPVKTCWPLLPIRCSRGRPDETRHSLNEHFVMRARHRAQCATWCQRSIFSRVMDHGHSCRWISDEQEEDEAIADSLLLCRAAGSERMSGWNENIDDGDDDNDDRVARTDGSRRRFICAGCRATYCCRSTTRPATTVGRPSTHRGSIHVLWERILFLGAVHHNRKTTTTVTALDLPEDGQLDQCSVMMVAGERTHQHDGRGCCCIRFGRREMKRERLLGGRFVGVRTILGCGAEHR